MKRVYLVIGLGGHIGSAVAAKLLEAGETVRGLALPREDVTNLYCEHISIVRGDVRNLASLEPLFLGLAPEDETVVIHAAGIVSAETTLRKHVIDVNVTGTKNVVELCRRHSVKKLVYVSSVQAIPDFPKGVIVAEIGRFSPEKVSDLYAKTKAEATQIVLDAARDGLDATVVQPSGVINPFDYGRSGVMQMAKSCLDGSLVACLEGGFDFVDVRDVAQGIIAAVERGKSGCCYILSNRYYSVRELVGKFCALSGARKVKGVLPMWLAYLTAPFSALYHLIRNETPAYTAYTLKVLTRNAQFSSAKARRELGYRPRDIAETMRDAAEYCKRCAKGKKLRFRHAAPRQKTAFLAKG